MRSTLIALLTGLTLAATGAPSPAGFTLQFADSGGVARTDFVVAAPGGSIDIRVYLAQTDPDTILADEGLIGAGVLVGRGGANPGAAVGTAIAANPGFDTEIANDAAAGRLELFSFSGPAVTADADGRVLLGTFTFSALSSGTLTLVDCVGHRYAEFIRSRR